MTLIALAAAAFTSAPAMAEKNIVIDGSTTVGPIAKAFADYYKEKTGIGATISESGSGNGVKSLINGACDIANMSRFMKDSEFKTCVEKGILPVAHVVAFDGLAVVVNPANKVGALTMAQLADIYTGKIRNWKELGGDDAEIVVISRDTNSGTYETFNELVLRIRWVQRAGEDPRGVHQKRHRIRRPRLCGRLRKDALRGRDTAVSQDHSLGQIPDSEAAFHVHEQVSENGHARLRLRDAPPLRRGQGNRERPGLRSGRRIANLI